MIAATDYRRVLALALDIQARNSSHAYAHVVAILDAVDWLDPELNAEGVPQHAYAYYASARNLRDIADLIADEDGDTRVGELYRLAADEIDRIHA